MTNREFLEMAMGLDGVTEEFHNHAADQLEKLDAANAKRAAKQTEKQVENQSQVDRLVTEVLSDEPMTASDVYAVGIGTSVQKASYLCRAAVAQGKAAVQDVKIKGKGVQKAYTRVVAE